MSSAARVKPIGDDRREWMGEQLAKILLRLIEGDNTDLACGALDQLKNRFCRADLAAVGIRSNCLSGKVFTASERRVGADVNVGPSLRGLALKPLSKLAARRWVRSALPVGCKALFPYLLRKQLAQDCGARQVRISVEGHVDAFGAGGFDAIERLLLAVPIGLPGRLKVRNLQTAATVARQPDLLGDSVFQLPRIAAHVRCVELAVASDDGAERFKFLGRRGCAGRIHKAGGEASRSLGKGLVEQRAKRGRERRAAQRGIALERGGAQGSMAYKGFYVGANLRPARLKQKLRGARKGARVAEDAVIVTANGVRMAAVREGREAAVADQFGGDALQRLCRVAVEQFGIGVAMQIDKAGRQSESVQIDGLRLRGDGKMANGSDTVAVDEHRAVLRIASLAVVKLSIVQQNHGFPSIAREAAGRPFRR